MKFLIWSPQYTRITRREFDTSEEAFQEAQRQADATGAEHYVMAPMRAAWPRPIQPRAAESDYRAAMAGGFALAPFGKRKVTVQ